MEELKHYGVPGMKWGHRKSRDEIARDTLKKYGSADKAEKAIKKQSKIKRGAVNAGLTVGSLVAAGHAVATATSIAAGAAATASMAPITMAVVAGSAIAAAGKKYITNKANRKIMDVRVAEITKLEKNNKKLMEERIRESKYTK